MDDVIHLALELADLLGVDAELFSRDVALHGRNTFCPVIAERAQRRELLFGCVAQKHEHARIVAFEQLSHEALADEAAGAGHEIDHRSLPIQGVQRNRGL